jgi:hypothetical protein
MEPLTSRWINFFPAVPLKWITFFLALVDQFFPGGWLTFFLTIARLLRHEEITTTADIYSHVSEHLKRQAINKLNHFFKDGTNRAPKTI